jgi:hypothetical protein
LFSSIPEIKKEMKKILQEAVESYSKRESFLAKNGIDNKGYIPNEPALRKAHNLPYPSSLVFNTKYD